MVVSVETNLSADRINGSFILRPQKEKADGNTPAGFSEEVEIHHYLFLLPLIFMILEVKVKITWVVIIRKQR